MEIRMLEPVEFSNAAGLSRYVFDNCLKYRMDFPQTISFVEEYITENNLISLYEENKVKLWGVFEQNQLVGVSALQSDGLITMLYVLPQCWKRGYGKGLLTTMREYGKHVYGMDRIVVNATPAWTGHYFIKQGFSLLNPQQNPNVPYVPLFAPSSQVSKYQKKKVPMKIMVLSGVGCLLFATVVAVIYMMFYLM